MSCRERPRASKKRSFLGFRRIAATILAGYSLAVASYAHAAEWSVTSSYTSSVDYDSNRALETNARGSEAAVVTADFSLRRALEDSSIFVEPRYSLRHFSDPRFGNGDDRSLATQFQHLWERSQFTLNASIHDQSTLTTAELLEVGIVQVDLRQRTIQGSGDWKWSLSETRQLFANVADSDVHYHGTADVERIFPGYKYRTASFGENFLLSPRTQVAVSGFGNAISTDTAGNSSHEYGLEAQLTYAWTDRVRFVGSLGRSRRVLAGQSSNGTDLSASLTYDLAQGSVALNYSRNLVPYGAGFYEQRQQVALSLSRQLAPHLKATASYTQTKNNEVAVVLSVDRPHIDMVQAGLDWNPVEHWAVGVQLSSVHSTGVGYFGQNQAAKEWRSSVYFTWTPRPRAQSW